MPYIVGQDDRLGNVAQVLLAAVQSFLAPRCFTYTGIFPGPPDAPCDVLAVYLDPNQPVSQAFVLGLAPDDFPCAVGQIYAHYVIHIQRCCAIPAPVINEAGQVTTWLNTPAHTDAAMQSARDLLSVYQGLLCNREALFGDCTPMRVAAASTTIDSCYVHKINVDIAIDSDCCAAVPCEGS